MRIVEAHRSVCSTVAPSPILAVQLAERALTACNYSENHLLALPVDVIRSANAGAAQHGTCACQFLQTLRSFLYVPVGFRANFLLALHYFGEDSEAQSNIYPNEFLNTLLPVGMPQHRLNLKVGAPIILVSILRLEHQ